MGRSSGVQRHSQKSLLMDPVRDQHWLKLWKGGPRAGSSQLFVHPPMHPQSSCVPHQSQSQPGHPKQNREVPLWARWAKGEMQEGQFCSQVPFPAAGHPFLARSPQQWELISSLSCSCHVLVLVQHPCCSVPIPARAAAWVQDQLLLKSHRIIQLLKNHIDVALGDVVWWRAWQYLAEWKILEDLSSLNNFLIIPRHRVLLQFLEKYKLPSYPEFITMSAMK